MIPRRLDRLTPLPLDKKPEVPTHPGYHAAGARDRPDTIFSAEFQRRLRRHIARHLVLYETTSRPPRFLCIQGNPGEGKTETVQVVCSRDGVDVIIVAAAELAGATENAGVEALERLSEAVRLISQQHRRPLLVLFDDFDLSSVARLAATEYTVNSQLLTQYFQFIADTGALRTADGLSAPIVMTGNDFTPMRSSLLRPGRADFFSFAPSFDEKVAIVAALLAIPDRTAVRPLVWEHRHEPIAFFAALKTSLSDQTLDAVIAKHGLDVPAIQNVLTDTSQRPADLAHVRALALRAANAGAVPQNFLTTARVSCPGK